MIGDIGSKIAISILVMLLLGLMYFSFGIFLFVTRRKFGHININVAVFTIWDKGSKTNKLRYKSNETNVPLREVLQNRYLFWYVVWRSLYASLESPVLELGSHAYSVLSPLRGRAARPAAGMELKRLAGAPFIETSYMLCIVYDRAEDPNDERSRILRAILIPKDIFEIFKLHEGRPPINKRNWELMKKIYQAWKCKNGSFIQVDITTA
jgi:hypothetical protein